MAELRDSTDPVSTGLSSGRATHFAVAGVIAVAMLVSACGSAGLDIEIDELDSTVVTRPAESAPVVTEP